MPEHVLQDAFPQRAPIAFLVTYLKTRPDQNVRELIARRLATGVFHADSDEVVYWAAVHHAYHDKGLDPVLEVEVLAHLSNQSGPGVK